ncbi:hypothetical protein D9M68_916600 [compost metagenome]
MPITTSTMEKIAIHGSAPISQLRSGTSGRKLKAMGTTMMVASPSAITATMTSVST